MDRKLGDAARNVVVLMAARQRGVVPPEIREEFQVTRNTVYKFLKKLVREGYIIKTDRRRRRDEVFGRDWPGKGGWVYVIADRKVLRQLGLAAQVRSRFQRQGRRPL